MRCLWALCFFGLAKSQLTQEENIKVTFNLLRKSLNGMQETIVKNGSLVLATPDRTKRPRLNLYQDEMPEDIKYALYAISVAAMDDKLKLIPRDDVPEYFFQSANNYYEAIISTFERTKDVTDVSINKKAFIEDRVNELCLEMQRAFIESDLYKHDTIGLDAKSLELAEFIREIYLTVI